ncbi:hypothetical protein GOBAR_DD14864 [Gossypium barbadense]|nr:hypothetical protein GOBAR_DD14864 [Gossypium barbadense]
MELRRRRKRSGSGGAGGDGTRRTAVVGGGRVRRTWEQQGMARGIGDILIRIVKQNGCPAPTPLPNMLERFTSPDEEGDDDEKEDTPIAPLDYEQVFHPDHSSTRGMVIHDSS